MRNEILALLDQKGDLPSFPDVLLRLQEKIRCPNVVISDIAKLIESDISLAGPKFLLS